ncbi:MAG: cytochrome c biogenesis protein ResB [Verrucomicrobia bacterium]|nr:cytochrome c biogenesis protein ResB [Verrucomicrobiota bacterium]
MNPAVRSIRNFFVSLTLTVVLLALSLLLVFASTLAQVDLGIYTVQEEFYRSWIAIWHVGSLYVPLPGGYLVGGLLLLNLVAAHIYRLKFEWRKAGIQLTHAGIIVLLIGELLTGLWQEDYQMTLKEGEIRNYSESFRLHELVLIDTTDAQFDEVVAIPDTKLARTEVVQHPKLPFRVATKAYYVNAALARRDGNAAPSPATAAVVPAATQGIGPAVALTPLAPTYKMNENNQPAAVVELVGAEGSLGTWLVSPDLGAPQTFTHAGRTWSIALRVARAYKPFSLQLLKVTHDVYVGTDTPKNYSSRIKLMTPDGRDDREVLIYMNNPLRYGGYTFYQYQMNSSIGQTGLQVVRNPSWLLPYIACIMMSFGLLLQFGLSLLAFIAKRRATPKPAVA